MPWWVYAVAVLLVLAVAGRVERRLQRWRFGLTLRLHGYDSHGEYVSNGLWKARRRRWLADHGWPPCRVCRGSFDHLHHRRYTHAGGGEERDRDLVAVSDRCHRGIHWVDRHLRKFGVPLSWSTWLVVLMGWPLRCVRQVRQP
jgi:hypothetical protein